MICVAQVTDFRYPIIRLKFPTMEQLRVNTAALQTMAARWGSSLGELTKDEVPAATGAPMQPSALAVSAAHVDISFFTAKLASRIDARAHHVVGANTNFIANEARSADALAALTPASTAV